MIYINYQCTYCLINDKTRQVGYLLDWYFPQAAGSDK